MFSHAGEAQWNTDVRNSEETLSVIVRKWAWIIPPLVGRDRSLTVARTMKCDYVYTGIRSAN